MVQLAMVKLGNVKEMIGERWGGVTHREGKAVKQCQWGELNKYTHTHTGCAWFMLTHTLLTIYSIATPALKRHSPIRLAFFLILFIVNRFHQSPIAINYENIAVMYFS